VTSIETELFTDRPAAAVAFYEAAFGAVILHRVGDGDDIVAQLAVGDARFWVTAADPGMKRLDPGQLDGATGRTLLVTDDPAVLQARAVAAGAVQLSSVAKEHGWELCRILDPFGHEWELGRPLGDWPPSAD